MSPGERALADQISALSVERARLLDQLQRVEVELARVVDVLTPKQREKLGLKVDSE